VLIVLGLLCLAVAWLCWTGRWRGWLRMSPLPQVPLTLVPGLGACLLLVGIGQLLPDVARGVCFAAGIAAAVAGAVLVLWAPRWYGPRWFRERDAAEPGLGR
jgi:hypothetical protein